jgi:hypothetical protein
MKKSFLLIAVLFLVSVTDSYSQYGHSRGRVNSNFNSPAWKGRFTNIPANASSCDQEFTQAYTGAIPCNLDSVPNTPFYCLDLCAPLSLGDSIRDSASTIPEAIYITNTYYPSHTGYAGELPDPRDEACAVQMAIWHFRNALVINSVTMHGGDVGGATIRARAQTIVDETIANGFSYFPIQTLQIMPAENPNNFYIRTIDTAGNPVAVNDIMLSITGGGSLSTETVNTDHTGNSPVVIVNGFYHYSVVEATARVQVPGGTTYSGLNETLQLVVLGKTTTALKTVFLTWGTLPVELSSFTASPNKRDINLNWSTMTESNNSGFDVERKAFTTDNWTKVGYVAGNGTSNAPHDYTFCDRNLASGIYTYRLKQTDFNGNFEYHNLNGEVIIGVPNTLQLIQNYPNPFNPSTTISFDLPVAGNVTLKVFNTSGKEVAALVNEERSAGYYSVNFDASNLSSGVYYCRLEANGMSKVMKMAVVK